MHSREEQRNHDGFRRFMAAQVEAVEHDTGCAGQKDVHRRNVQALEWINKNAARFRDEWPGNHTRRGA